MSDKSLGQYIEEHLEEILKNSWTYSCGNFQYIEFLKQFLNKYLLDFLKKYHNEFLKKSLKNALMKLLNPVESSEGIPGKIYDDFLNDSLEDCLK